MTDEERAAVAIVTTFSLNDPAAALVGETLGAAGALAGMWTQLR